MATNPALEAAIEANPDDVEAYNVYGDWLQTEGDPRGELIALQAAQLRDPTDKKLAQRADKHLKEHASALLGTLAEYKKLGLVWRCGFIHGAEIQLDRATINKALRALIRHPSGRFLRSLRVVGKDIYVDGVVDLLLEEKRPTTLADLRFAGLTDEARDRLRAVFPQLGRSRENEWESIATAVAEQRRGDLKYDPAPLAELKSLPGETADITALQILGALKLEIDKGKPIAVTVAMKRTFTADSLDRFAVGLGNQFAAGESQAAMKWGFLAMGKLGGPATAAWIGDRLGTWSHQRATQGVDLLSEIGTPEAVLEIYAMSADATLNRPRRDDATTALDVLAKKRGQTVDQLLDRSVPVVVSSARLRAAVTRRLLAQMIDGYRMDHREFMRNVVTHPGLGPFAERLVWASFDGADVEVTFRSTGERVVDLDGEPVDLEDSRIGIVHPAELGSKTRAELAAAWAEAFDALEIQPLFPQLDRPVFEPKSHDDGHTLTRFKLRTVGYDQLRTAFGQLDWIAETDEDDRWGPTSYERRFRRDNAYATAVIIDGAIGVVNIRRDGKLGTFGKLHPVTKSELLSDLETATTRPGATVEPPKGFDKGARVEITRGDGRGMRGVVFWFGDGNNGTRCGVRADDGETYWVDLDGVKLSDAPVEKVAKAKPAKRPIVDDDDDVAADAPAPSFAKGTHVKWKRGKLSGTGTVFWLGKNKFGDGMRAGLKDDETGETVWADAADCSPDGASDEK